VAEDVREMNAPYRHQVTLGNIRLDDGVVVVIDPWLDGDASFDLIGALAHEFGTTHGRLLVRIGAVLTTLNARGAEEAA
jgi:hypothetical protein